MPQEPIAPNILIADPPWEYRAWSGKESRTSDAHYQTMSIGDLCAMRPQIDNLAGDNAALFLWGTPPTLHEFAFPLMEAWGFDYKTFGLVWVKLDKKPKESVKSSEYPVVLTSTGFHKPFLGLGHYTRSNLEVALLGIKGRAPIADGASCEAASHTRMNCYISPLYGEQYEIFNEWI